MNKLQVRIGKLLSIFSLVIFMTKLIPVIVDDDLNRILTISNLSFLFYAFIFCITFLWNNIIARIIQIGIIFIESLLGLSPDMSSSFFGLSMMIIVIVLLYMYGFFNKHKILKCIFTYVVLFFILALIPLSSSNKKYLYAFQWTSFISVFLFLLWFILKDNIEKEKIDSFIELSKLISITEGSKNIAHDSLEILKKYIEQNKRISND